MGKCEKVDSGGFRCKRLDVKREVTRTRFCGVYDLTKQCGHLLRSVRPGCCKTYSVRPKLSVRVRFNVPLKKCNTVQILLQYEINTVLVR